MQQLKSSPKRQQILLFSVLSHAKSDRTKKESDLYSWHRFFMNVSQNTRKLVLTMYDVTTESFQGKEFVCSSCVEEGEYRSCSTFSGKEIIEHEGKCPGCGKYADFIPKDIAI